MVAFTAFPLPCRTHLRGLDQWRVQVEAASQHFDGLLGGLRGNCYRMEQQFDQISNKLGLEGSRTPRALDNKAYKEVQQVWNLNTSISVSFLPANCFWLPHTVSSYSILCPATFCPATIALATILSSYKPFFLLQFLATVHCVCKLSKGCMRKGTSWWMHATLVCNRAQHVAHVPNITSRGLPSCEALQSFVCHYCSCKQQARSVFASAKFARAQPR